jgi:hypothetical protein
MDITDEDLDGSHRFSSNSLSDEDDQEEEDPKDSQLSSIGLQDPKDKQAANLKSEKTSKIRRKGHGEATNFIQNHLEDKDEDDFYEEQIVRLKN